jgi:glycosyltransferase involved in cell wall biosynthesis
MPKVSVIIPNYNHARFLEQRIESVLNQTYQDFEVIYLDDASIDNSREVLSKYLKDERIRVINNKTNSGSPFKQWNKGIREAGGEYVWIAEADDYADLTLLKVLVECLDANPSAGLAYCQSWIVDESGTILGSYAEQTDAVDKERWRRDYVNSGKEECRSFLSVRNTIPNASAILMRRDVYREAGYADESMRYCGDWMMWVKMLLLADVAFISQPLNYFRFHSRSVRSTINTMTSIQEKYLVQRCIRQNINLPTRRIEPVLDGLAYSWVSSILPAPTKVSLKNQRAVCEVAQKVDPFLTQRLVRQVTKFLFTKFATVGPVRTLRSVLKRI